jgi:hypothetical protein
MKLLRSSSGTQRAETIPISQNYFSLFKVAFAFIFISAWLAVDSQNDCKMALLFCYDILTIWPEDGSAPVMACMAGQVPPRATPIATRAATNNWKVSQRWLAWRRAAKSVKHRVESVLSFSSSLPNWDPPPPPSPNHTTARKPVPL